jgi:hypothetical protein
MTFENTPHGPLLTGSSPELLRTLLLEFEDELESLGCPTRSTLLPGLDRVEIEAKLASRGLACPEELVVWFEWHNGYARDERAPIGGLPLIMPASLDDALAAYDDSRMELELAFSEELDLERLSFGAVEGWLRLASYSETVAVECSIGGATPPRIRWANVDFAEPGFETRFRAVSLCTVIHQWIADARDGAFVWNDETRWFVNYEKLHTELTQSMLG